MSIEIIISLFGFTLLLLGNIIAIASLISKQSTRLKTCEDSIKILFSNDELHSNEIKLLYEIKGQLELLIKHTASQK